MEVYKAITAVMAEIGTIGISKDKRAQSFNFRGIDDVLNALNPILSKNNLVLLPRVQERDSVERVTKSGSAIFYVTIKVEFDFVSAIDGTKHTVSTYGEAMDSSDKATNKAMSAAYKYACFQAFCIPTEVEDADEILHEVTPEPKEREQITDSRLAAAIAKIKSGEYSVERLLYSFNLTESQTKVLNEQVAQ